MNGKLTEWSKSERSVRKANEIEQRESECPKVNEKVRKVDRIERKISRRTASEGERKRESVQKIYMASASTHTPFHPLSPFSFKPIFIPYTVVIHPDHLVHSTLSASPSVLHYLHPHIIPIYKLSRLFSSSSEPIIIIIITSSSSSSSPYSYLSIPSIQVIHLIFSSYNPPSSSSSSSWPHYIHPFPPIYNPSFSSTSSLFFT